MYQKVSSTLSKSYPKLSEIFLSLDVFDTLESIQLCIDEYKLTKSKQSISSTPAETKAIQSVTDILQKIEMIIIDMQQKAETHKHKYFKTFRKLSFSKETKQLTFYMKLLQSRFNRMLSMLQMEAIYANQLTSISSKTSKNTLHTPPKTTNHNIKSHTKSNTKTKEKHDNQSYIVI